MTFISVPEGVTLDGINIKTRNNVVEVQDLKTWSDPIRTVGNKQRGDRINADFWVQEDWSGGLGFHTHIGSASDPENRDASIRGFFDSTLETRWAGQVTLAEKVQAPGVATADDLYRFVAIGTQLFAFSEVVNQSISVYSQAATPPVWIDNLDMSGASFNNLVVKAVFPHNGLVYGFGGTGNTVAASGVKWDGSEDPPWVIHTPSTTNLHNVARSGRSFRDIMYIATYDTTDDLVRIEQSTDDGNTWAIITGMELTEPMGTQVELIEYFDAGGQPVLYLHTDTGLYLVDIANSDLVPVIIFPLISSVIQTEINSPGRPVTWNGLLYLPRGEALIEFHHSGAWRDISFINSARVPDTIKKDTIAVGALAASGPWLFVGFSGAAGNSVWAYDGEGFHYIWASTLTGGSGRVYSLRDIALYKKNGTDNVQLHIASNNAGAPSMSVLEYPLENPREQAAKTFEASGYLITPYFDAGMTEVDAVILGSAVGFADVDADDTIKIETDTDYSGTYESDSDRIITFNNTHTSGQRVLYESGAGFAAKAWRHKYTLARGSTTTITPTMFYPITYFEKVFTNLRKYIFEVDIKSSLPLNGPDYSDDQDLLKALETSHEKIPLLAFSYSGTNIYSNTTRYVRIDNFPHVDRPGVSGEVVSGAAINEAFIRIEIGERI